ncbi:MAG: [FeFe] hydrogenase, group A [Bacillales bacterium]|jgi:NADP-reducing hydrogenase subunit HndD|nr:[FeFe] hydrogenase, group A [Bacillales bacterium]
MSINLFLNGLPVSAEAGQTVLQVAKENNIKIPTLCYLFDKTTGLTHNPAACRVCMVEIKGRRNLAPACVTEVSEGMEILTNTQKARLARKTNLELLLSDHPKDCFVCEKSGKCELQKLSEDLGVDRLRYEGAMSKSNVPVVGTAYTRDDAKCVLCGRCVDACKQYQEIAVISATKRGFATTISGEFGLSSNEIACINCGQCVKVCPTGALLATNQTEAVFEALNDPEKYVVVHTAPSTRVSLGEEFGLPIGTNVQGKMVHALRLLGFKKIFDTNFGADLTIMEESNEFLDRVLKGTGKLPLMTSCCPGWVKYVEHYYPEFLDNLSSCKSPQGMQAALIKSYFAEKEGIDPKKIITVSIMPCIAKKFESARAELGKDGIPDNDISISVKELAVMIRKAGIQFNSLNDQTYDSLLGEGTGAADIFGNTGGVMEAVVRNAAFLIDKQETDVDIITLRGEAGITRSTLNIGGHQLKLAVASGLANAKLLLDAVKAGTESYDAIEIMACPGGCINGGGQPEHPVDVEYSDILKTRHATIRGIDKKKVHRISAQNSEIQALYKDYLKKPGSHKAHELLHTHFTKR